MCVCVCVWALCAGIKYTQTWMDKDMKEWQAFLVQQQGIVYRWYRTLECTSVNTSFLPTGGITLVREIRFKRTLVSYGKHTKISHNEIFGAALDCNLMYFGGDGNSKAGTTTSSRQKLHVCDGEVLSFAGFRIFRFTPHGASFQAHLYLLIREDCCWSSGKT